MIQKEHCDLYSSRVELVTLHLNIVLEASLTYEF